MSIVPPEAPTTLIGRQSPLVEEARPVVKWAGGKTRLLTQLEPLLPTRMGRYFEPFFGGGAMFFHLQPLGAVVSDLNEELVNLYRCIRDDVEALVVDLKRHPYDKDYYYAMRAKDPTTLSSISRASRMLYLNRTCFNGLYRVNRRGAFNVPFGKYTNPTICHEDRLRAVSEVLETTDIRHGSYAQALDEARAGDFVYFDPPYQPLTPTANFTSYTKSDFGEAEQAELAATFAKLDGRGVRCMLSNSYTPLICELYADFRIDTVLAPRAIARTVEGRAPVLEVVVRNYT